ncbi:putative homoserine acetyltransferase family protein [Diaporthe ampelina]|uniref:Putative homoserine acetyltransferase family protein n=1 Tax=Diaporthe ampelina TaxID=1214573 RepID=A0A0G2F888_9PEZI|nr:putative homoserine acetyltransferase family protein [Diaporthe ampelina]
MAEGLPTQQPDAPANSGHWPATRRGEYVLEDFAFSSGETMAQLRLHYQTLGAPRRTSRDGETTNAVLIMHGTGGSSDQFLNAQFAGELFNPGQPLDAQRYFIVLRDGIGHGRSSKPSTSGGLHAGARFPKYRYGDMVRADYRLLTEHLGVGHLRLAMGTSMGGMQTWLWGEAHPGFVDALMPLASLPVQISGRNRMWRKMAMDAIRADPAWEGGDYPPAEQPLAGLTAALDIMTLMSSSPLQYQAGAPTRDAADSLLEGKIQSSLRSTDANDLLFALDASFDYDPRPDLHKIAAPLVAVNTADDQINPPELGILERETQAGLREGLAKVVVLPITEETRGHGSHTVAKLWKHLLEELLLKTDKS